MTELEKYKKALELACEAFFNAGNCLRDYTMEELAHACVRKDCGNCWRDYFLQQAEQSDTKPMTNREWLESLSDEELAKILFDMKCWDYCSAPYPKGSGCPNPLRSCRLMKADWLQAEHEEDTDDETE